jgi:hypothetical protein
VNRRTQDQLNLLAKALRRFLRVISSYAKVRLPPRQAWSGPDRGATQSGADVAGDTSGSQQRAQRVRYRVADSMAQRGASGNGSGYETLEAISETIPTCGLHGEARFTASGEPPIAFRRVAPLPQELPLPGGLYEWFDSDWRDVFVACPLNWKSEHRPLSIVDLAAKRVLWQVWEPHFTPELARQAANMAVELVELGRRDKSSRPYERL